VIAGPGNVVDDITFGQIRGWAGSTKGVVMVGDDSAQATTTGGTYGFIDLGSIVPRVLSTSAPIVSLVSPAAKKIKVRITYGNGLLRAAAAHHLPAGVLITGTSTATIETLDVEGYLNCLFTAVSTAFISHTSTSTTIAQLNTDKVAIDGNSSGTCYILSVAAGCTVSVWNALMTYLGSNGPAMSNVLGTVGVSNHWP
jgi:hypothetical protein